MEYKEMIKKIAKMCDYYAHCNSPEICPLQGAAHECRANHSPQYLVFDPKELDEVERIVTEWEKPVDWEAIAERAKTEDIKVLVWEDEPDDKFPRYFALYNTRGDKYDGKKFGVFANGATRWSNAPHSTSWWSHAELVEEDN